MENLGIGASNSTDKMDTNTPQNTHTNTNGLDRLRLLSAALKNYDQTVQHLVMPEGKTRDKFTFDFGTFGTLGPTCVTAACAIGMAAMLPAFQEQGLYYEVTPPSIDDWNKGTRYINIGIRDVLSPTDGFWAAAAFFDISKHQATLLFSPSYYRNGEMTTPAEIAASIDRFIKCVEEGVPFECDAWMDD